MEKRLLSFVLICSFLWYTPIQGQVWEPINLGTEQFSTYDIISADLTGDGKPDILESNSDEVNRYFRNQLIISK